MNSFDEQTRDHQDSNAPMNVKPQRGEGGRAGRATHETLTVRSVPRVGF